MSKEDGGPAFARPLGSYREQAGVKYHEQQQGMSLRDYFAGQAVLIFEFDQDTLKLLQAGRTPDHTRVAKFCYEIADAMLEERKK